MAYFLEKVSRSKDDSLRCLQCHSSFDFSSVLTACYSIHIIQDLWPHVSLCVKYDYTCVKCCVLALRASLFIITASKSDWKQSASRRQLVWEIMKKTLVNLSVSYMYVPVYIPSRIMASVITSFDSDLSDFQLQTSVPRKPHVL